MLAELLSKECSIFLIVAAGYLAARFRLFPHNGTAVLSKFLFNIASPSMVFITMQGWDFEGQLVQDTLWTFVSFTAATILLGLLSFLIVRPFQVPESEKGIYRVQLVFKNVGFMGIPVTAAVFGEMATLLILLINIAFVILIYSFGVFMMLYQKGEEVFDRTFLKRMLNNGFIASILGLIIFMTGFRFPEMINGGLQQLSNTMIPLGMFIIGVQLSETNLLSLLSRRNLWVCFLSLIVVPLLTLGFCRVMPLSNIVAATLVFAMAMPGSALSAVMAEEFGRNTRVVSESVALSTFFSLFTLLLWAVILLRIFPF